MNFTVFCCNKKIFWNYSVALPNVNQDKWGNALKTSTILVLLIYKYCSYHWIMLFFSPLPKQVKCINDNGGEFQNKTVISASGILKIKGSMMELKTSDRQLSYLQSSGSQSIVWMLNSMVLLAFVTSVQWTPPDFPPVKHCRTVTRNIEPKVSQLQNSHYLYRENFICTTIKAGSLLLPKWARSPPCRTWLGETRRLHGPRPRCPSASEVSLRWSKCWLGALFYAAGWQQHKHLY